MTVQREYLLEYCKHNVVHFELDVEQSLVSDQDHQGKYSQLPKSNPLALP